MIQISDQISGDLLENSKYVVVDLYSTTCGPCKMLEPVFAELKEYNKDVVVCKGEVNDNMELALKYGVRQVPTILYFKDNELVNKTVGFKTLPELKSNIDELVQ